MGILSDLHLNDVEEPKAIREVEGREFRIELKKLALKKAKSSGNDKLEAIFAIEGEENALPIFHHMSIPTASDDAEKAKFKLLQLKRFCSAMDIDADMLDEDSMENYTGKSVYAILKYNPETDEYAESNSIARFVTSAR